MRGIQCFWSTSGLFGCQRQFGKTRSWAIRKNEAQEVLRIPNVDDQVYATDRRCASGAVVKLHPIEVCMSGVTGSTPWGRAPSNPPPQMTKKRKKVYTTDPNKKMGPRGIPCLLTILILTRSILNSL